MNEKFKRTIKRLIREIIEEKNTDADKSLEEMMESLSKEIKKPVVLDDAGNYNICECEPHHISIRPVAHDIFDLEYFKDRTDRKKFLYLKFEDLTKTVKELLNSKDSNYVDTLYQRNVENSKDKEGGKKADKDSLENVVNPEKDYKPAKEVKAKPMNDEKDNPDQPMREIGKFDRLIDYKSKKPDYKPPTLPKNLQKLVIKYTKAGKQRKNK